jgi:hypothetical protein
VVRRAIIGIEEEKAMSQETFETFEDFWPYYLREHSDPTNRALHAAGTLGAAAIAGAAIATRRPGLALLAPIVGYGAAWMGHFAIEKNRPATFRHPVWSLRADARMTRLMLAGELDDELQRLGIEPIIDMA